MRFVLQIKINHIDAVGRGIIPYRVTCNSYVNARWFSFRSRERFQQKTVEQSLDNFITDESILYPYRHSFCVDSTAPIRTRETDFHSDENRTY